jgi:hypothetical protein
LCFLRFIFSRPSDSLSRNSECRRLRCHRPHFAHVNLRVFARRRRPCRGAPDTETGSKARTYLKRLTKPTFNEDEEDDYERGYLLLASIYIENGKYDLAQGLLNKAIASNKSCCRAWELLGLI